MPLITQLPCEIVGAILGNLDHLQFLLLALLACRHFYNSFKESHGVEASILRQQITPALIPYSVTLMEASRLPPPLVASSVLGLLDELYRRPDRLAARLKTFPITMIRNMCLTHDAIHALATDFAISAFNRIPSRNISTGTSTSVALSPLEHFRFCRAFYRVELFYTLFRDGGFQNDPKPWFFSSHPPWENEQLGCVYEYLEARLAEGQKASIKGTRIYWRDLLTPYTALLDVATHDILCGEIWAHYLTSPEDNQWRQIQVDACELMNHLSPFHLFSRQLC